MMRWIDVLFWCDEWKPVLKYKEMGLYCVFILLMMTINVRYLSRRDCKSCNRNSRSIPEIPSNGVTRFQPFRDPQNVPSYRFRRPQMRVLRSSFFEKEFWSVVVRWSFSSGILLRRMILPWWDDTRSSSTWNPFEMSCEMMKACLRKRLACSVALIEW